LEHGIWAFDDAAVGLVREPFISGIPEIIESIIGPDRTSFTAIFSDQPFPGGDITLARLTPEAGGYWYRLQGSEQRGWLCPATLHYFSNFPGHIVLKIV
jgi:hypothetical protein